MNSAFLRLSKSDFIRGFVVAISTGVLIYLQKVLTDTGIDAINWQMILNVSLLGGIGYLLKNLVTNSKNKLGRKEPKPEPPEPSQEPPTE